MSALSLDVSVSRSSGERVFTLSARLRVPPGITAVLGPSGAGKSTLLGIVAGVVSPDRGKVELGRKVFFDGDNPRDAVPPEQRKLGVVFQSLALFPHLTAIENVAFGARRAGMDARGALERAREWLVLLEVDRLSDARPGTLSGGEAQRVALARALAVPSDALLLDEPFSALDRRTRTLARGVLEGALARSKKPCVLVTHDEDDVRALGARRVRLEGGELSED